MRELCFHVRPVPVVWLVTVLAIALSVSACRRGSPILDPTARTPDPAGTISGTVRGPLESSPVSGRTVQAVNLDTGALVRGRTNETGGYTFKVPPGRYRVEVTLLPGETLVEQPDVLDVSPADLEVSADFVLGSARESRPRVRPLRMDDGLGAPSA